MSLANGYHDLPPGKVAFVVTYLEMLSRPASPGDSGTARPQPRYAIRHVPAPDLGWYRDLFRRVGADWLWASRLRLTDQALATTIRDPAVSIYTLVHEGRDEGLLELDFRVQRQCELAFFGVTAPLIGCGAARHLMQHAITETWNRPVDRFWVHTCTGDHPSAPVFYQRSGFVTYRTGIEIADDPRLDGLLPETAAPHVPLIRERQGPGRA